MSAQLRLQTAWRLLGYTWLLLVSVLSLARMPQPIQFEHADKWTHWAVWMLMMFWFGSTWPAKRFYCLAGLLAASIALELLQGLLPWRFMDINDGWANLAGLLSGSALLFTPLNRVLPWFDDLVANRLDAPPV